ncbi:MAG: hypothetical protein H0X38_00935 [Planctomycetes bacterium]|nr:hypothetical protein [Planctomycetota bacterium]
MRDDILDPLVTFSRRSDLDGASANRQADAHGYVGVKLPPVTKAEMLASVLGIFGVIADADEQSTSSLTAIMREIPDNDTGPISVRLLACEILEKTHNHSLEQQSITAGWVQKNPFDYRQTKAVLRVFPENDLIKETFLDSCLQVADGNLPVQVRELLMEIRFPMVLGKKIASHVVLKLMPIDTFSKNLDQQFWPMVLITRSAWYAGIVDSSMHPRLQAWISGADELKTHLAIWLLLLSEDQAGARAILTSEADGLARRWLADGFARSIPGSSDPVQHFHDALVLAFLPDWEISPEVLSILMKRYRKPTSVGGGKLFANQQAWLSLALFRGDQASPQPAWVHQWRMHAGSYVGILTADNSGVISEEIDESGPDWKPARINRADLPAMLRLIGKYPRWSGARESLRECLDKPQLSRMVLGTLATLGVVGKDLVDPVGLSQWLGGLSRDPAQVGAQAVVDLGKVYVSVLGDSRAAKASIALLPAGVPDASISQRAWTWDDSVELWIALDRDSGKLDEFRSRLLADASPGSEFRLWLLDVRRGRPVGPLPKRSLYECKWHDGFLELAAAFSRASTFEPAVIQALRDPFMISDCAIVGLDRDPAGEGGRMGWLDGRNPALGLLGALDRQLLLHSGVRK